MTKEDRIINEIVSNGMLEEYKPTIMQIAKLVSERKFSIAPKYNDFTSSVDWHSKLIRLSLKDSSKGKKILWDLLHELGHLIDGEVSNHLHGEELVFREMSAWANAKEIMRQLPVFNLDEEEFDLYSNFCLDTYRDFIKGV